MDRNILRLVLLTIGIKLLLVLSAVAMANWLGIPFDDDRGFRFATWDWRSIFGAFSRSDSGWYTNIVKNGWYDYTPADLPNAANGFQQTIYAFFPLWPESVRVVVLTTGWGFPYSAFVANLFYCTGAVALLYRVLVKLTQSERLAMMACVLVLVWPFGHFLHAYYTEAPFLFLLSGCFLSILDRRWWQLALFSGLLTLTRPNGIVMGLPLGLFILEQSGTFTRAGLMEIKRLNIRNLWPVLTLLAMPLALGLYCVWLYHKTGDALAFLTAQKGWAKQQMWPWQALFADNRWDLQFNSFYVVGLVLLYLLVGWRQRLSLKVMFWLTLLLPLSAGNPVSIGRYMAIVFPWHLGLAQRIQAIKPAYMWMGAGLLMLANIWTFLWFLRNAPLGY